MSTVSPLDQGPHCIVVYGGDEDNSYAEHIYGPFDGKRPAEDIVKLLRSYVDNEIAVERLETPHAGVASGIGLTVTVPADELRALREAVNDEGPRNGRFTVGLSEAIARLTSYVGVV